MKRFSAFLLFAVLGAPLLIAQAAPQATPDDTVVEEIIARVNNNIITRADLRQAREQLLSELHQPDPATAEQDAKNTRKTCCAI